MVEQTTLNRLVQGSSPWSPTQLLRGFSPLRREAFFHVLYSYYLDIILTQIDITV
jgi:hypothetical protein